MGPTCHFFPFLAALRPPLVLPLLSLFFASVPSHPLFSRAVVPTSPRRARGADAVAPFLPTSPVQRRLARLRGWPFAKPATRGGMVRARAMGRHAVGSTTRGRSVEAAAGLGCWRDPRAAGGEGKPDMWGQWKGERGGEKNPFRWIGEEKET